MHVFYVPNKYPCMLVMYGHTCLSTEVHPRTIHDRKNLVLPEKFLSTSKQPSVSACIASNTLSYG